MYRKTNKKNQTTNDWCLLRCLSADSDSTRLRVLKCAIQVFIPSSFIWRADMHDWNGPLCRYYYENRIRIGFTVTIHLHINLNKQITNISCILVPFKRKMKIFFYIKTQTTSIATMIATLATVSNQKQYQYQYQYKIEKTNNKTQQQQPKRKTKPNGSTKIKTQNAEFGKLTWGRRARWRIGKPKLMSQFEKGPIQWASVTYNQNRIFFSIIKMMLHKKRLINHYIFTTIHDLKRFMKFS